MTALQKYDAAWGDWPQRISASWRQSAAAIIETGRLLNQARTALGTTFDAMTKNGLPFTKSTASRLIIIASDETLVAHVQQLPPSWGTLYELTKLDDADKRRALSDGIIKPDTERAAAVALRKGIARAPERQAYQERIAAGCTLDDLHNLAASGHRYAAIMADPNWDYVTYSGAGRNRSPDRHYVTDDVRKIAELPVRALAADNSVLHLWCMDWLLTGAIQVIESWGFTLINVGFVWFKNNPGGGSFMGLGHWTRNGAELCLFATKGRPHRRDASVRQVIEAPVGRHSEKPEEIYGRVERLTAGPYIELFARKERTGWTSWGNEIPRAQFLAKVSASAPTAKPTDQTVTAHAEAAAETPRETIFDPDTGEVKDDLKLPDFLDRNKVPA